MKKLLLGLTLLCSMSSFANNSGDIEDLLIQALEDNTQASEALAKSRATLVLALEDINSKLTKGYVDYNMAPVHLNTYCSARQGLSDLPRAIKQLEQTTINKCRAEFSVKECSIGQTKYSKRNENTCRITVYAYPQS